LQQRLLRRLPLAALAPTWHISPPSSHGSFPERWRGMIPGTQAAFKLITDRMTRIKPGAEVVSGIGTVESRGHTPGHMFILIASNGEQALVIGDAISFAHPDWKPSYGFLTG
jgi:glyoxylase-like metal-dependent hydrolase (beta-lactamase superfamily II)